MSAVKERESIELDRKKVRALPVEEAVKYAFKFPPEVGTVILGPPGIGKTELVIEYARGEARKKKKEFINLNTARAELPKDKFVELITDILRNPRKYYVLTILPFGATMPDDLLGVPQVVSVKDGGKTLASYEESALKLSLAVLTVRGVHGVLLIDDALNANDNVRRSFLQAVFQERLVGGFDGVKLSPNVRLIATGNLTSESELVMPLQKPMVGRAWMIYATPNPLSKWYEKMERTYGGKWFKEVYAFLKKYEKYYSNPNLIEEEPPTGPVPRAWTKLAISLKSIESDVYEMLKTGDGCDLLLKLVAGFVGVEAGTQLVAFLSKPVVSVDEVVKDIKKLSKVVTDMDLVFRFTVQLTEKIRGALNSDKHKELFTYLVILDKLMEKTTKDVAMIVYDMLQPEERRKLKKVLMSAEAFGSGEKKKVSERLLTEIFDVILADILVGAQKW